MALNLFELADLAKDPEGMVVRLQEWGLIPKPGTYKCPRCKNPLKLAKCDDRLDEWIWQCYRTVSFQKQKRSSCATRVGFRTGTCFARSKLSLQQILGFVDLWADCASLNIIRRQIRISQSTAVDWSSFCREGCLEHYITKPTKLGGPGIVVEIDESKFGRRKYHHGHRIEGQWVFGGYKRGTGDVFMVALEDRSANTLLPIIKNWIAEGSIIISDYWKAYDALGREGYEHLKVNHSLTFKDPETGTHTNFIEASWRAAKATKTSYGRIKAHIPGNLARYMFLKRCNELQLDRTIEFYRMAGELYNPVVGRETSEEQWSDDGEDIF